MPRRVRPSIIPEYKTGFSRWRALVFVAGATVLFVVATLALTAYLGFAFRVWVDTEDVPVLAAERFGRFKLPPDASEFRAQARGTPLAGELMVSVRLPPEQLESFLTSCGIVGPLKADRRIEQRLASATDRRWWWRAYRDEGDRRQYLAAELQEDGLLKLLLVDTTRTEYVTVYLYVTNR